MLDWGWDRTILVELIVLYQERQLISFNNLVFITDMVCWFYFQMCILDTCQWCLNEYYCIDGSYNEHIEYICTASSTPFLAWWFALTVCLLDTLLLETSPKGMATAEEFPDFLVSELPFHLVKLPLRIYSYLFLMYPTGGIISNILKVLTEGKDNLHYLPLLLPRNILCLRSSDCR